MKLLHLSDLHLGRRLCEIDLTEDQNYILEQCLRLAKEQSVDAVLIAGDIYDRNVPTVGAVSLLDDFLTRLSAIKIPVYIISGNHDSADRLGFGSRFLEKGGVHLASLFNGELEHYVLQDGYGPVHLWALPFVRPGMVRSFYPEQEIGNYTDAINAVIKAAQVDAAQRNILMAHQFVTAGGRSPETCESETLNLGTLDNVEVSAFDVFDYVALGHIHGPQQVGRDTVRYCGSPLAYSVSEARHKKSVVLVELGPKGTVEYQTVPLKPLHPLRRIEGPLEELMEHAAPSEDYIYAVLTDAVPPMNAAPRLRSMYPNLVKMDFAPKREAASQKSTRRTVQELPTDGVDLFDAFYQRVHNRPMEEEEREVVRKLFEEVEE